MASFNFYLKNARATSESPLYLLFDDGVNRAKFYIQQSIKPKDWNPEKGEARKTLTGFSDFNGKLDTIAKECKRLHNALTNDGSFSVELLRDKFRAYIDKLNNRKRVGESDVRSNFDDLTAFVADYLHKAEALNTKSKGTIRKNKQTLTLLHEFEKLKGKKIKFAKVDSDFYNEFVDYITRAKVYSLNTIGKHIGNLNLFLNKAARKGIKIEFDFAEQFKAVSEDVEAIYLTEDEVLKIYQHDFSGNVRLERVRDLFIVGCWTGLRFSDFSQLTTQNINEDTIKVKTQKTGETVYIPVHWMVREMLNKYAGSEKGLPPAISNQKMNVYLKEVGKVVGIDKMILQSRTKGGEKVQKNVPKYELISTHTGRRSFATNLYVSKFPTISIMKITGHKTEEAFLRYIRISPEQNADMLRKHWASNVKLRAVG